MGELEKAKTIWKGKYQLSTKALTCANSARADSLTPNAAALGLHSPLQFMKHVHSGLQRKPAVSGGTLRVLSLPPPSQGTRRRREEGLHLREAREQDTWQHRDRRLARGMEQARGGQEVGSCEELLNPRSHSPGQGLLPVVRPRERGRMARGSLLPTRTDSFLGD